MQYTMILLAVPALAVAPDLGGGGGVDAYLDPGTGSLIIQVVIGMAVGALAFAGIYWRRVRSFFRNIFSKGDQT